MTTFTVIYIASMLLCFYIARRLFINKKHEYITPMEVTMLIFIAFIPVVNTIVSLFISIENKIKSEINNKQL